MDVFQFGGIPAPAQDAPDRIGRIDKIHFSSKMEI
jgi:hypothetical protein